MKMQQTSSANQSLFIVLITMHSNLISKRLVALVCNGSSAFEIAFSKGCEKKKRFPRKRKIDFGGPTFRLKFSLVNFKVADG